MPPPTGSAPVWVLAESLWQDNFEGSWVMCGPCQTPSCPPAVGVLPQRNLDVLFLTQSPI